VERAEVLKNSALWKWDLIPSSGVRRKALTLFDPLSEPL
jgi:hypothetical protein